MDRKEIIDNFHKEIDYWKGKVDGLKVQARLGQAELHDRVDPEIEKIERHLASVKTKLSDFQKASGAATDDLKHGFSVAFKAIKQSFEKASEHLKNKD